MPQASPADSESPLLTPEAIQALSYEEAYAQLETLLARLEAEDLPLKEALATYETAVLLTTHCARRLSEAELRVRQWQEEGGAVPFSEWSEQ